MKPKGPLVTLAVGAVLAAGLLIANFSFSAARDAASTGAAGPVIPPTTATSPTASASVSASGATSPLASAAPAVAGSALPAAPAPGTATRVTYAGTVNGGGSLSVAVKGTSAVAYLCDGVHEAWLWGSADGTSVTLRNTKGDTLTGRRGGGKLTGSVTVRGTTWTFTLATVKKPSGLYRATAKVRGATVVAGWVVLPDGSQVGAWTADGANVTPAPPIDVATGAVTVDGAPLTATEPEPAPTAP